MSGLRQLELDPKYSSRRLETYHGRGNEEQSVGGKI
jgi:hypothetical protein